MDTKRYNIFREIFLSLYCFRAYSSFTKNKAGKTFLFAVLTSFAAALVSVLLLSLFLRYSANAIIPDNPEELPYFTIENGILQADAPFDYESGEAYIYVNPNRDYTPKDTASAFHNYLYSKHLIVAGKTKALVYFKGTNKYLDISYDNFIYDKVDNSNIVEYINNSKKLFFALFTVFIFFFIMLTMFFASLFNSLCAIIISLCLKASLSFCDLYKIALHTYVPAIILSFAVIFSGMPPAYNFFLKFAAVMVYSFFAISTVKRERELDRKYNGAFDIDFSDEYYLNTETGNYYAHFNCQTENDNSYDALSRQGRLSCDNDAENNTSYSPYSQKNSAIQSNSYDNSASGFDFSQYNNTINTFNKDKQ